MSWLSQVQHVRQVWIPHLNHVGLWVDDLDAAVKTLQGNGVRFAGQIRVGAAGHKIAFVHPKVRIISLCEKCFCYTGLFPTRCEAWRELKIN